MGDLGIKSNNLLPENQEAIRIIIEETTEEALN